VLGFFGYKQQLITENIMRNTLLSDLAIVLQQEGEAQIFNENGSLSLGIFERNYAGNYVCMNEIQGKHTDMIDFDVQLHSEYEIERFLEGVGVNFDPRVKISNFHDLVTYLTMPAQRYCSPIANDQPILAKTPDELGVTFDNIDYIQYAQKQVFENLPIKQRYYE